MDLIIPIIFLHIMLSFHVCVMVPLHKYCAGSKRCMVDPIVMVGRDLGLGYISPPAMLDLNYILNLSI